jgi:biopolymer transport protein ExbD
MKRFCLPATLLLALGGCSSTNDLDSNPKLLTVAVMPDGELQAQGFTLAKDDLPTFAKEVGDRHVKIVPVNRPSYRTAIEARDALKAAGISNVTIGPASGG